MVQKKSSKRFLKTPIIIIAVLVVAGLIVLGLELTGTSHIFHKQPQSKAIVTAGKPVVPPPKPSTGSNSQDGEKTLSTNNSQPGGATYTRGSAAPNTNANQWTTSATGYITVKSPPANAKLQDGNILAGSAKVNLVNYRLIDNSVGVVAQGQLAVVNGNFSGSLHFQSKGTGGRLDVFSTDAQGVEYNEIQINVTF